MSEDTGIPTPSTVKLRPETQDALRDMFRAAGGIFYSAPKGQTAAILESKLFQLLAGLVMQADATGSQRAALLHPDSPQQQHEQALRALVGAICPGLDSGDLLADAGIAASAIATTEPLAYFSVDDQPAADGSPRYVQVAAQFKGDEDVFPLYRRAPTVAELAAHIAQHQVADDAKPSTGAGDAAAGKANPEANATTKTPVAPKASAAGKAAPK